jgi:hypothetical protein
MGRLVPPAVRLFQATGDSCSLCRPRPQCESSHATALKGQASTGRDPSKHRAGPVRHQSCTTGAERQRAQADGPCANPMRRLAQALGPRALRGRFSCVRKRCCCALRTSKQLGPCCEGPAYGGGTRLQTPRCHMHCRARSTLLKYAGSSVGPHCRPQARGAAWRSQQARVEPGWPSLRQYEVTSRAGWAGPEGGHLCKGTAHVGCARKPSSGGGALSSSGRVRTVLGRLRAQPRAAATWQAPLADLRAGGRY